jgi:xanthine dehydrogenase molybdopterin-binding subunit B
VNAYANDGTIEVFHSGVEIGQGINTKVAQAVAMALGVDLDSIIVGDQSTSVIPNGGCTGGSGTSESCVGAALLACAELNTTLEPFKSGGDDDGEPVTFADAASAASGAGLSLSATGWFNSSPASETGSFDYFTQGVGMAEVEIDCLTGEVSTKKETTDPLLFVSLGFSSVVGRF